MDIQTLKKALQLKHELDYCIIDEERAIDTLNSVKKKKDGHIRIGETQFFIGNEKVIELSQMLVEFYHKKRVEAEHNFRVL